MPHRSSPYQQTWPALAQRKRNRAEKLERQAAQSRAEADELDRRYAAFDAKRKAARVSS